MGSLTGSPAILFGGFPALGRILQRETLTRGKHDTSPRLVLQAVVASRFQLDGTGAKKIPNLCPARTCPVALLPAGANAVDVSARVLVVGIEL